VDNREVDGATFTGSFDVGMQMYRDLPAVTMCARSFSSSVGRTRPLFHGMPISQTRRQAFIALRLGCRDRSALRLRAVIVEEPVYDELVSRLKEITDKLVIGDPTERNTYLGPVINQSSYNDFKNFTEEINQAGGKFLTGGHVKTGGIFDKGYFCEPTFVTDSAL
jgi:1-pyrroline-5-carboxylate dehydrogenase